MPDKNANVPKQLQQDNMQQKKMQQNEQIKQATQEAAKMAANVVAGPVGGALVEAAAKTELGQKALDTVTSKVSNPLSNINPLSNSESSDKDGEGPLNDSSKIKKIRKIATMGCCISALFGLLMVVSIYCLILIGPMMLVDQITGGLNNVKTGFEDFGDHLGNFFSFEGWCSSDPNSLDSCEKKNETKFFNKAKKTYEDYQSKYYTTLDMPLIMATLFYNENDIEKLLGQLGMDEDSEADYETDYKTAGKELGELAKAMVNKTIQYRCVDDPNYVKPAPKKEVSVLRTNGSIECGEGLKSEQYEIYTVDDAKYKDYLAKTYIKDKFFSQDDYAKVEEKILKIIDQIYDNKQAYIDLVFGKDDTFNNSCGGTCEYKVGDKLVSNLKVRLLQCAEGGTRGEPIPGEELVDFEKYVLGVTYGEIGSSFNAEAQKTEAIAARSYALLRPSLMGNAVNLSLEKENGQWILQIRNCTEDQVYCDPDRGCSKNGGENATVYSGYDKYQKYFGPLDADADLRKNVAEVVGKVLLDDKGNIINAPYKSNDQNNWNKLASEGKDYTEILLSQYPTVKGISNGNCKNVCGATGDYTQWKQGNSPWSSIIMGTSNSTIGQIGCLATSVAMQIARSGVNIPYKDFNPGVFVQELSKIGGLYGGNLSWSLVGQVVPNFNFIEKNSLPTNNYEKLKKIKEKIDEGCYMVIQVKDGWGEHWVAVDYVDESGIYMMDPASSSTSTWNRYKSQDTVTYACFKVT
ncbi:MAG: SpoIID/LytB domain-containing protein [Bacilli bacterium]